MVVALIVAYGFDVAAEREGTKGVMDSEAIRAIVSLLDELLWT
jgi:hypothetical protein